MASEDLAKRLDKLIAALERSYPSTRRLIWRSFLQGLFVGIGATIGLSILVALVTYLITAAKIIPLFEQFIQGAQLEQLLQGPTR